MRPGMTASQPSSSMTPMTLLLASGWNFTRISPTTPTRGLRGMSSSGSSSNSLTIRRHSHLKPTLRPSVGEYDGSTMNSRTSVFQRR